MAAWESLFFHQTILSMKMTARKLKFSKFIEMNVHVSVIVNFKKKNHIEKQSREEY